jgi:hypothetical protein
MALSHLWPGRRGLASAAASTRRHTGQTSSARLDISPVVAQNSNRIRTFGWILSPPWRETVGRLARATRMFSALQVAPNASPALPGSSTATPSWSPTSWSGCIDASEPDVLAELGFILPRLGAIFATPAPTGGHSTPGPLSGGSTKPGGEADRLTTLAARGAGSLRRSRRLDSIKGKPSGDPAVQCSQSTHFSNESPKRSRPTVPNGDRRGTRATSAIQGACPAVPPARRPPPSRRSSRIFRRRQRAAARS